MQWFRHYHGLCTDPKLHKLARRCRTSRAVVIAAWCAVLETASAHAERGCIGDLDPVELGFMVDVSPTMAGKLLDAFRAVGMLDEAGHVTAWHRRQRESDDAAERKRRQRERNQTVPNGEAESTRSPLASRPEDRPHSDNPLNGHDTGGRCHGTKPLQNQTQIQNKKETLSPVVEDSTPRARPPAAADDGSESAIVHRFCEDPRVTGRLGGGDHTEGWRRAQHMVGMWREARGDLASILAESLAPDIHNPIGVAVTEMRRRDGVAEYIRQERTAATSNLSFYADGPVIEGEVAR